jgi:hypothetical protein
MSGAACTCADRSNPSLSCPTHGAARKRDRKRAEVTKALNAPPALRYPSLNAVKVANENRGRTLGRAYWFGASEMEHFGTRVYPALYGGKYFVTSEYKDYDRTARAFTIREALADGSIDTVGTFLGHDSMASAILAIGSLLAAEEGK